MKNTKLDNALLIINHMENVMLQVISEYEHDLVRDDMDSVFDQIRELDEILDLVETDIRICKGLEKKVMLACERLREKAIKEASTK